MLRFSLLNVNYPSPLVVQHTHPRFKSIFRVSSHHFFPSPFSRHPINFLASSSPSLSLISYSASFASHSRSSLPYSSSNSIGDDFDIELDRLLALLPEEMRRKVREHPESFQLIEVVMDFGRKPLARFPTGDFVLSENRITLQDIENATSQVGDFAIDNRVGISRTLHRISAIRNRKSTIIGLTCRVGRAISGSANLLQDLVQDGASLLLIGPPGVGKTTIIRDIARMLADDYKKRVMIVDTSNEIGGDGDIPHAGIGNARRMQVPDSNVQHEVLIEAVENHMPQVIVIDEISTKLEAMAASTIAQRGIQLVATAHGATIENLIMNPSLEILVGGIQSVTLGDEEANRRGVQKTVLERKGPPTFSCGVEIISKTELRVHRSLAATVDAVLLGLLPNVEICKISFHGVEKITRGEPLTIINSDKTYETMVGDVSGLTKERSGQDEFPSKFPSTTEVDLVDRIQLLLYIYGITEMTVTQGIKQLEMDAAVQLTDNISEADALLALHSKLKKNPRIQAAARSHGIPVYVTKTSSIVQVTQAIRTLVNDREDKLKDFMPEDRVNYSEKMDALEEARVAIEQVVIPKGEPVELLPRQSHIIFLQVDLIQKYQLQSETVGQEPEVRLRILPFQALMDNEYDARKKIGADNSRFDDFLSTNDSNGTF